MILVSYDASSEMALLLEENQLAYAEVTDFDSEFCKVVSACAIRTVVVFHTSYSFQNVILRNVGIYAAFAGADDDIPIL